MEHWWSTGGALMERAVPETVRFTARGLWTRLRSVVRPLGSVKLILVVSFSGPSADACAEVDLTDLCRCDPAPRLLPQSGFSEFTWTLRAAAASRGRPGDELSLSV